MPRTILYTFWGRRENIAAQLPFIERILDENPSLEFEGWDLARDPEDSKYIRALPTRDRFRIRTEFYNPVKAAFGQSQVWRCYASPEYQNTVFAKLDDDVTFIETAGFPSFLDAATANPDAVISALTVNNGCSTRHIPALWNIFEQLDLPGDKTPYPELAKLLAVHRSTEFAERCHRWFHTNWRELINQVPQLIPTDDWLSINAIAYTHQVGRRIAKRIGKPSPERVVAGRPQRILGDEGSANRQPRYIHTGMVCGHLTFGPQQRAAAPGQVDEWREMYADMAQQYLATDRVSCPTPS